MKFNNQIVTILLLTAFVVLGIAAMKAPQGKHKNLKILPQDISDQKLDSIMQSYTRALGMGCGFCHTPLEKFPDSLDYASDANEMKENARRMMRMTIELNKNYFYFDTTEKPVYLKTVNCYTCHRGEPYPVH